MASDQDRGERSPVVGVFDDRAQAEQAVEQLRRAGFRDDDIGFATRGEEGTDRSGLDTGTENETGSHAATGAVAGGVLGGLAGAAAALLIPGIGPVVAGGILAATLGGAAIGAAAGGLIGALTGMGVPEDEARYYDQQVQEGRTIVTVKAGDRYQEARDILRRYGASDYGASGYSESGTMTTGQMAAGSTRTAAMSTGATATSQGEIRVPEVEERLEVEKRPVQAGEVRIRKDVEEEQQTVPVELRREEVHVEKRDVPDRPLQPGEQAFQEGTIRVPVHAEEAYARKEAVVTGEVVVNKEQTTEREEIADTVRRTEVHVENQGETVRPAGQETVASGAGAAGWDTVAPRYRNTWQQRYGTSGGRWEDYEPAYRYGYEMRDDPRYQGRSFDEVEGDLEKDWAMRNPTSPWEKAKASVREPWSDVKSAV